MSDEDLDRAVAAAMKCGLTTPEEIASYVAEWLAPAANIEVRELIAEVLRSGPMVVTGPIVMRSRTVH